MNKSTASTKLTLLVFLLFFIQSVFSPVTVFGENNAPQKTAEQENAEAALAFETMHYGSNWKSHPTDTDILNAVKAFPKKTSKEDTFTKSLGKSYTDTITTYSLGSPLKMHSLILAKKAPQCADNVFVECNITETQNFHAVSTGQVDTYTSKYSGFFRLKQLNDGSFSFGDGDPQYIVSLKDENGNALYGNGWINVKTDKYKMHGSILDGNQNPMPYVTLLVKVGEKEEKVLVDSKGSYEYSFDLANTSSNTPADARIRIIFNLFKDSKEWLNLILNPAPEKFPTGIITVVNFPFDPKEKELEKNIDFSTIDKGYVSKTGSEKDKVITNINDINKLKNFSVVYKNYADAIKFTQDKLKVDLSKKIPLKIELESDHATAFDYTKTTVYLGSQHTLNVSSNTWVQNHEFGHYVMHTMYGKYPTGCATEGDTKNISHGGYANEDTADSFIEGFANYFGCLVAKYKDNPSQNPDVMGVFGSINDPWVTWDNEGMYEEFAFASVMWDLTQKAGITPGNVWSIFRTDRGSFSMYYKELIKNFPDKKSQIDSVYKAHGVYAINIEGNKTYDAGEAYLDLNSNGRRDSNESFVDYSMDSSGNFSMDPTQDAIIGQSANYERIDLRYSSYMFPNSYLKVDGISDEYLKVMVKYMDGSSSYYYDAPVYNGKVYICRLPESVEAQVIVMPPSSDDEKGAYYTSTTMDLRKKFYDTKDSDSLDTAAPKSSPNKVNRTNTGNSSKPYSESELSSGKKLNILAAAGLSVLFILFAVLAAILMGKSKVLGISSTVAAVAMIILLAFNLFSAKQDSSKSKNTTISQSGKSEVSTPVKSTTSDNKKANNAAPETNKLYYESGALKYEGNISDGKPNGKGKYYFENGKIQYDGTLLDGKANGYGTRYNEDGNVLYQGEFVNGVFEGTGKMYYKNGDYYEGEFHNNKLEGSGAYFWASGKKYVGEWKNSLMDGKGVYTKEDGTIYHDGLWKEGKPVK